MTWKFIFGTLLLDYLAVNTFRADVYGTKTIPGWEVPLLTIGVLLLALIIRVWWIGYKLAVQKASTERKGEDVQTR